MMAAAIRTGTSRTCAAGTAASSQRYGPLRWKEWIQTKCSRCTSIASTTPPSALDSSVKCVALFMIRSRYFLAIGSHTAPLFHPTPTGWQIGLVGAADRAEAGDTDGEADAKAWTLANDLLSVMEAVGSDFTNTFRALMAVRATESPLPQDVQEALRRLSDGPQRASDVPPVQDAADIALVDEAVPGFSRARESLLSESSSAEEMATAYRPRMPRRQAQMLVFLAQQEPALRPQAMAAARDLMRSEDAEKWARTSQEEKNTDDFRLWLRWLARFVLAVHTEVDEEAALGRRTVAEYEAARQDAMRHANPRFVLRNYIAQLAIERAETNDFSEAERVLERMRDPYDLGHCTVEEMTEGAIADQERKAPPCSQDGSGRAVARKYNSRPPLWSTTLCVSCSS